MLKANKSKWFEDIFSIYNRNLLKRRFHSFNVLGLENLAERDRDIPTLIYANHSSWWDGLVAFQIVKTINSDFYVMMEEKQLKNLRLFRKLGAFSVVRENPRSAVESINYASEILKEKRNSVVCLFPQGEILPNHQRPIKFFHGISRIVEKVGDCQIYCLAMRYEFLGNYKPEIFVDIGNKNTIDSFEQIESKKLTKELESKMTENLDNLKKIISEQEIKDFTNILNQQFQ